MREARFPHVLSRGAGIRRCGSLAQRFLCSSGTHRCGPGGRRVCHGSRWFHAIRHYSAAGCDADRPRLDSKRHALYSSAANRTVNSAIDFARLKVIGPICFVANFSHWHPCHDNGRLPTLTAQRCAGEHRFHFFTSLRDIALIRFIALSVEHIGGRRDQNQAYLPSRPILISSSMGTCMTSSLFMRRPLLVEPGKAIALADTISVPLVAQTLWKARYTLLCLAEPAIRIRIPISTAFSGSKELLV